MNLLKVILIIIAIIIAIISLCSLIFLIYTYILFRSNSKIFIKQWFNNLQCGDNPCKSKILNLPVPKQYGTLYQKDMAKYCANLIYRIALSASEPFIPPQSLKEELKVWNIKESPVFGIVWTYQDMAFVIFRGTQNIKELMQDLTIKQEIFPKYNKLNQQKVRFLHNISTPPEVHTGFLEVYTNFREKLVNKLNELKPKQVIVAGHSLGGAVSTICGLDLKLLGYNSIVYNFASPRVGNDLFCDMVKSSKLPVYRIVNTTDIIPTFPSSVSPNFLDDIPYIYTHCGKMIAFTSNWKSYVNNHLLPVYMDYLLT